MFTYFYQYWVGTDVTQVTVDYTRYGGQGYTDSPGDR